jgi:uncharacterized protein DUF6176
MHIEATRFKVKKDKKKAMAMLGMLNQRKDECLATLYRVKMFFEAIFTEVVEGVLYMT